MKIFSLFEKSVGAVVFKREGGDIKYLLIKYGYGRDHWSLPKGHIEGSETFLETLKRELKEETAICEYKIIDGFLEVIKFFYIAGKTEREYRKKKGRGFLILKRVYFYLLETEPCEVCLSHEHSDYAWLTFPEVIKKVTYDGDKGVLKKAHNFLSKHCQEQNFK